MIFDKFTDRARHVMAIANQEAQRFNHEYIGTEHILLGVCREGSGVGAHVLKSRGIQYQRLRVEIEKIITKGPEENRQLGHIGQTPRAKKVIEFAVKNARELGHDYVGTEHILLGLIDEKDGVAGQIILNMGLTHETARADIMNLLAQDDPRDSDEEKINKDIESYQDVLRDAVVLSREKDIDITAAFAQVMAVRRGHG
tara:strand:+ start:12208 stop:12804 length:597 start_codon:yes stop_codon:yes gene_type:complete